MSEGKFSVIVPVYNVERYLCDCLIERLRRVAGLVATSRSAWAIRQHCLFLPRFLRKGEKDACRNSEGLR